VDGEAWALARVQFDSGEKTDGFVDWFASQLRRRVQSRLIVATVNSGYIQVAYWGVSECHRDAFGRELALLASSPRTGVRAVGLL
jgi:hypothetical protein